MARGAVCLTFDFDALSSWVARGMTSATPRSRGEFAAVAVPRLLSILDRRGLPSTWFVPGHTARTYPELCRTIAAAGHEVALHGYAHENVAVLSREVEKDILDRSFDAITEVTGRSPRGFRAPAWDLSDNSVELLIDRGLTYDSSLMGHDYLPYYCRTGDRVDELGTAWGRETSLVEIPVSWTLDDFPYLEFLRTPTAVMPGLRDPAEMFANWSLDLRYMLDELGDATPGVLTVTMHPEVIGRGHRLVRLAEWLDAIMAEDVEFVTAEEVADRFRRRERQGPPC
ncbi:MAG TPA: polysaccharide deacetylase [Actinopolymorphaceae bacterium]